MKILLVSLLKRNISPDQTASRPRMIYELGKGLLNRGHEVTVLGTEDSVLPGAKIIGVIPKAFNELPSFENPFYAETSYLLQLEKKLEEIAPEFDMIHNHTYPEFLNLMATDSIKTPMLTTVHAQATPEFDDALSLFPKANLVSISKAHQKGFVKSKPSQVIYNGIDTSLYKFSQQKEDYMLWIGRLSKSQNSDGSYIDPKGIRHAIQLARETNQNLKLSGNIEDINFFKKDVEPFLNDKIQWIGKKSSEQPLSKDEVVQLMQSAKVFLMTINWNEPFGLVVAEAMSCGTPVIGFKRGAIPELIADGKTGFTVDPEAGIDGLKEALSKIDSINPIDCRRHVEENFSIQKMIDNYENAYKSLQI